MRKLSLRIRLTLIVLIIITAIALMLTLIAMHNAKLMNAETANGITFIMSTNEYQLSGEYEKYIEYYGEFDENMVAGETEGTEDILYEMDSSVYLQGTADAMESMVIALETMQSRFDYTSLIFMIVIIIAGGVITYFALGRGLKPIRQLSNEIEGITENELNLRVSDFESKDEINKLADSFNTLMERLEKAFTEQKNFSTSAAHELKTPLAAIKANIDVLEMDVTPSSEEYAQTIAVVKKQTERMTNLVDDLFSFSSGDYELEDSVDLSEIVDGIIEDLAHTINEKNLSINLDLHVEKLIKSNHSILQRILSNLIGNAVSYTEADGEISISTAEDNSGYFIEIADTGAGIPTEYTEKIFQPFFRIDSSRSRKAGGAGLGLAIANSMAEKIGGKISVSANSPKGSIFTLYILSE